MKITELHIHDSNDVLIALENDIAKLTLNWSMLRMKSILFINKFAINNETFHWLSLWVTFELLHDLRDSVIIIFNLTFHYFMSYSSSIIVSLLRLGLRYTIRCTTFGSISTYCRLDAPICHMQYAYMINHTVLRERVAVNGPKQFCSVFCYTYIIYAIV